MAALIASIALSGCRNSDGTPVSGGRVFLTRPGTQTNVVAYKDADATSAHTLDQGGVPLDAGGRAKIYVNEPADVRVQTAYGLDVDSFSDPSMDAKAVQVRNVGFTGTDPVSGAQVAGGRSYLDTILTNLAASLGGVDGYYRVAANGSSRTVQGKFSELQVSVKDFGALGNGVADDTVAIQNTINYVVSLSGGTVYFPAGTYLTSSPLTLSVAPINLRGVPRVSIIKNSNATADCITVTTPTTYGFTDLRITQSSSSSTGLGIGHGAGTVNYIAIMENVSIDGHATAMSLGTGGGFISNSTMTTATASTAAALITVSQTVLVGGTYSSDAGICIQVASGTLTAHGTIVSADVTAGIAGIDVAANGALYAYGVRNRGSLPLGLRTAATSGVIQHFGCDWTQVTDARTGAPAAYSFAGANNMTPLPMQAEVIRVAQATGAVVTTINDITAVGFKPFTLICSNTSAGASTFTFGGNYVLSAAVTPAAGTRVNLTLAYDPISGKTYETGRGATAN